MENKQIHDVNNIKRNHGDRIREIRNMEKLTQEKFIEIAEIDTKTLSSAENGERLLPVSAAIQIYIEFGYSLDWIYGISEMPKEEDSKYFVDIRDIIQINDETVDIALKSKYFKYLEHIEKSGNMKELQIDEDYKPLINAITKQKRLYFYSRTNKYRCASISVHAFTEKDNHPRFRNKK